MSVNPKPSYHLRSDFSISPPPNGYLTLGSIIKNLNVDGVAHPLSLNAVIDIPTTDIFPRDGPHSMTGFARTLRELRTVEGSIWAWILDPEGPGGKLSFLRSRADDETLRVDSLLTRYFSPAEEYMKKALETPGVATFARLTQMKVPIYMVTGLKVAVGAKLSKAQTRSTQASAEAAITGPHTNASSGAKAAYADDHSAVASFDGSKPFVLGIRVRKIWWRKDGVRLTSDDVAGAVLGDSDEEDEDEPDILAGLQFEDVAVGDDDTTSAKVFEEKGNSTGIEPCWWIVPDM